jgi:poly(ADP-ribose) glycohydrolase
MDAIYFRNPSEQFDMKCTNRELLKAYSSFCPQKMGPDFQFGIATGNWGCGAFNGDRHLKGKI